MKVRYASFSERGPRDSNQDCVLPPASEEGSWIIAAIADGIGGSPGGAEAAATAISEVSNMIPGVNTLAQVFQKIVFRLDEQAESSPVLNRMGTTLSVAVLQNAQVAIGHVGDTRIYHLRGSGLNSLTDDQTEVAELVRKGVLNRRQAKRYARRNVLLSALSVKGNFDLQETHAIIQNGDRILLLTDGVHQRLTRSMILTASMKYAAVDDFIASLRDMTIASEPSDNFSALAIELVNLD